MALNGVISSIPNAERKIVSVLILMAKRNLEKNSETAFLEFPRIYNQQKNLMSSISMIPLAECQRKEKSLHSLWVKHPFDQLLRIKTQ